MSTKSKSLIIAITDIEDFGNVELFKVTYTAEFVETAIQDALEEYLLKVIAGTSNTVFYGDLKDVPLHILNAHGIQLIEPIKDTFISFFGGDIAAELEEEDIFEDDDD